MVSLHFLASSVFGTPIGQFPNSSTLPLKQLLTVGVISSDNTNECKKVAEALLHQGALSSAITAIISMAESGDSASDDPKNFKYMQLWVSQDGETHIKECKMKNFDLQKYSSKLQFVKIDFGGQPTKIIFTEISAGLKQPLHPCPEVQFVIIFSGSWYIETTDGSRYEFQPGEVLFQDNTKKSPADKTPQHYSGAVGEQQPCQQFIIQFNRAPEVDNPEPF